MNEAILNAAAAVIAFAVTALLGFKVIPWLRKLKYGQTILDIGPSWHKSKQGTPTMGGIMFIIGVAVSAMLILVIDLFTGKLLIGESGFIKTRFWNGLIMALCFGAVGFIDDYIKVAKKRNLGLTAMQKTVMQLLITVGFLLTNYFSSGTKMLVPFAGEFDLGWVYWLFGIFVVYGTVNAVNLTDGIDGLCSSVTFFAATGLMVGAGFFRYIGISVLAAALAGGCAGFLVWNRHPAKVFMGDTGAMFLGGMVVAAAYGLNCPLILLPMGIIYVAEAASDIIQISYFKITKGKRLFKMAPIHHHFEMSGWSEEKIVTVFSAVTVIGAVLGVYLLYNC